MLRTYLLLCFGLTSLFVVNTPVAMADQWTNLRGTNTVEATLLGVWNGRALLRLTSGRQVSVKLEDLNAESRLRAQDMQGEIKKNLEIRIQELDAIATEAAAPAPATLPEPEPAPAYEPPKPNPDLAQALYHRQNQARSGHLRVFFDSLPASQKTQAEELFRLGLSKVNEFQYEQIRSSLHRLSELAVTRQRWLFSHPTFEPINESDREALIFAAIAFRQWGTQETASLQVLQANPLAESIAKLDDVTAPFLYSIFQANSLIASALFPNHQVEPSTDGKMIAKVVLPVIGTIQSVQMVQVEGMWAEGTTVEEAQTKFAGYKTSLAAVGDGTLRISNEAEAALSSLVELLTKLEAAKTKNAFHRALDEGLPNLSPLLNAWAGVKPQQGGYGDSSYGSSYGSSDPSGYGDPSSLSPAGSMDPAGSMSPAGIASPISSDSAR